MSLKRPESVLVIIYDQHHRVLVMQRDDDASFWQSVTGTIEIEEQFSFLTLVIQQVLEWKCFHL